MMKYSVWAKMCARVREGERERERERETERARQASGEKTRFKAPSI